MKKICTYALFTFLTLACAPKESIFELSPSQSMSITGLGAGQDAAFNPYAGTKSLAHIENLGAHPFTIRVQSQGKLVQNIEVQPKEKKEVILEKGAELYLDSQLATKAEVKFKKA